MPIAALDDDVDGTREIIGCGVGAQNGHGPGLFDDTQHGRVFLCGQRLFKERQIVRVGSLEHGARGRLARVGIRAEKGELADRGSHRAPDGIVDADAVDGPGSDFAGILAGQRVPDRDVAAGRAHEHNLACFGNDVQFAGAKRLQHRHQPRVAGGGELRDDRGAVAEPAFGQLADKILDRLRAGGKDGDERDQKDQQRVFGSSEKRHRPDRVNRRERSRGRQGRPREWVVVSLSWLPTRRRYWFRC